MAGSIAFSVGLEQRHHAPAELLAHLAKVHLGSPFGGAVYLEVVAIEIVELLQGLNDEIIDCR